MATTHTFTFSEQLLVRRRQLLMVLFGIIVLIPIVTFLFIAGFRFDRFVRSLPFLIPATLGPALVGLFLGRYVLRQFRTQSLTLTPTTIERTGGSHRDSIHWRDVTHVRVRERPNGQPQAIVVNLKTGRPITLFGFEPMQNVVDVFKQYLPPTIPLDTKRAKVDVDNPRVLIAILLLSACGAAALLWLVGAQSYLAAFSVFQLGFGLYFLIYRPNSRTNPALRKLDVGFGIVIVLTSSMVLILRIAQWVGWIR